MIVSWMLYSVAVTVLLGGAAVAAERCLRLFGRAARWAWVIALAAAVSLPVVGLFVPDALPTLSSLSQQENSEADIAATLWQVPSRFLASAESSIHTLDGTILILWISTSIVLLTLFSWSWRRLDREVRSCTPARVGGIPVLLSSALGPAVVGLKGQTIVLPAWVLDKDEGVRSLIARHELEHVRKGDQRLVLAAFLVVLLLPWNAALWWHSARLRMAVETDCDLRLLRSGACLRTYSRLLLEVGSRLGQAPVAALAFSRSRSSLFRRIQLMTFRPRKRLAQAALAATATLALALLACELPLPLQNEGGSQPTLAETTSNDSSVDGITVRVNSSGAEDSANEPEPLVYIDGVRVTQPVAVVLDTLSRDRIDRIEVVKGAAAETLHSERAAGGIIHIYMKPITRHKEGDSTGG
jgi:beta-lactamase regulating signal transducer with metallopeptidase domain